MRFWLTGIAAVFAATGTVSAGDDRTAARQSFSVYVPPRVEVAEPDTKDSRLIVTSTISLLVRLEPQKRSRRTHVAQVTPPVRHLWCAKTAARQTTTLVLPDQRDQETEMLVLTIVPLD